MATKEPVVWTAPADEPRGGNPQINRLLVAPGGLGVPVSATGIVTGCPPGTFLYRIRCVGAGAIGLCYDSTTASGRKLTNGKTMTVGEVMEIGEFLVNGLYMTVTSGEYSLVVAPGA